MDTLMIVEDEKMIRQGIAAMAKRTDITIGKILECHNGEEALQMIRQEPVDALFTDIRMPKMDGIALVQALQQEKNIPQIAVVSGYDDFNYAVEMLKYGAVDYILKPVKREKIQEVLKKMEANLEKSRHQRENNVTLVTQKLREILQGDEVGSEMEETLLGEIREIVGDREWLLVIAGMSSTARKEFEKKKFLLLEGIKQQTVILCKVSQKERITAWMQENGVGFAFGEGACRTIPELRAAFLSAKKIRCQEFVYGSRQYEEKEESDARISDAFAEKFVQQLPTQRFDQAVKELHNIYFQAKHGKYPATELLHLIRSIWKKLCSNYPEVAGEQKDPLIFQNLDEYIAFEDERLELMKHLLEEQMNVNRNQEKIYQAMEYIKENYQKDLNMAMVSNYVSMNYSLFSIAFKEYTGVNFVNHLKTIRIQEAKRLLEETDDQIQEISRKVGYENEKHFMKTFRTMCGVSPSEYRKNTRIY